MANLHSAVVAQQEPLSDHLWKITLVLQESSGFLPGQYQTIYTKSGQVLGPFSIASTPKMLPTVVFCLRHALDLELGELVHLSFPKGSLCVNDLNQQYVFCAAGTGITPFLSLMKAHADHHFTCLWSVKNEKDLLLLEHFDVKQPVEIHYYQGEGDPDLQLLLQQGYISQSHLYYLAGPYIFVQQLGHWLLEQGVPPEHIFSDMKKFV